MPKLVSARVTESVAAALGRRAKGPVIEGCKILGLESKKGRRYLPGAIAKAMHLYEGVAVYIDHPAPAEAGNPRPFLSKFGVIRNVRLAEDGSLLGDLHYNPAHPAAAVFEGWAEHLPDQVGFSHNAWCRYSESAPEEIVEIARVESVDIVANPATTHGLFESDMPDPMYPEMTAAVDPNVAATAPGAGLDAAVSALVAAVLSDMTLSIEQKRRRVLIAVDLMDDEEAAPGDDDDATPFEGGENDDKKKSEEAMPEDFWARFEERLFKTLEAASAAPGNPVKAPISLPPRREGAKPLTSDDLAAAWKGTK